VDPKASAEQLEISVAAPRKAALRGIGRFENKLARKGVIDLKPTYAGDGASGMHSKRDLVGKTTLTFTMGALGPLEMDLIAWTMGQWHRNLNHGSFSLRELARSLGVSWKGQLGTSIKNSFLRVKAMTITGRVWDAQERSTSPSRSTSSIASKSSRNGRRKTVLRPGLRQSPWCCLSGW
jgi:hypothetical protein